MQYHQETEEIPRSPPLIALFRLHNSATHDYCKTIDETVQNNFQYCLNKVDSLFFLRARIGVDTQYWNFDIRVQKSIGFQ
jgi:hypothetical protein